MRTEPASPHAHLWRLDPSLTYLNHGSFGACPSAVLEAQAHHRDLIEADAVSFFCARLSPMLDRSRKAVASLIGGRPEDYVFVPNATTGVATILDNIARGVGLDRAEPLGPGDELLALDHEYPACRNNLQRLAERTGAIVRTAAMPMQPAGDGRPIESGAIVKALLDAVTDRTRVCLLSHITSGSGAVLPVERLCGELADRGVTVVLDGAHAPGAVPFDVTALGVRFYTANCHKWLCTPKGAALLWVDPSLQPDFRPLVLSNKAYAVHAPGGRPRFHVEFDYAGTDDPTAAMAVADAVELIPRLTGLSWDGIMRRNRALAIEARDLVCERLGVAPLYADEMLGPMATIPLPVLPESVRPWHAGRPTVFDDALQDALLERHRIQIPIWRAPGGGVFDGRRYLRLSAQLYNGISQYARLAEALVFELERECSTHSD